MKLPRNIDRALLLVTVFILTFVTAFAGNYNNQRTFASNESGVYEETEEYFVTFYDDGEKLTVKTDAATVGEALSRAGIVLNETDIVEPGLDAAITMNNFFVNIHRSRPAVVKDGVKEKYVMSASYDPKQIARDAGLTIYDGDEVRMKPNANFLETGMAIMYEVVRKNKPVVEETETAPTEEVQEELVEQIVEIPIETSWQPLTARMGRNRYTIWREDGTAIEREETYYDLNMSGVMAIAARECGVQAYYTVREDGVKVDADGYVLVAAELSRYPRCSVVETSLGPGKVYDTGSFAAVNPEQFDLATDWTKRDGR